MSKSCLVLINAMSGNSSKAHARELIGCYCKECEADVAFLPRDERRLDEHFDRIVVCGGDGTLNSVLNRVELSRTQIVYFPCGTLNETARTDKRKEFSFSEVGRVNGKLFSYVLAAGSFTPLGYVVETREKKRFKVLAYVSHVLGEYRVHRIRAHIETDGGVRQGEYSLIMVINSPRCFGLPFNRAYSVDDGKLHLLTVAAPRRGGILGEIALFFPMFRAFFIGFSKPHESKRICFSEIKTARIKLEQPQAFCADGERWELPRELCVSVEKLPQPVRVVK